MFENIIGERNEGRMERLRIRTGLSNEEFYNFITNQRRLHAEMLEAEERLKKARDAFVESCLLVKKNFAEHSFPESKDGA
jgi:hypothetical protein